jgi:hypothetical protein
MRVEAATTLPHLDSHGQIADAVARIVMAIV